MIQNYLKRNNFSELKPRAVFFDMDGVLIDSMKFHAPAWVHALESVGLPFTEMEVYMFEGQPGFDTVNSVYRKVHGKDSTEEFRQMVYKRKSDYFESLGEAERIPYALEMASFLKEAGFMLYVVTGSAQPKLLNSLEERFPSIFPEENVISALTIKRGKPHPDPYLAALEHSGLNPWEAVVIENAPLGCQSARAANIFTVGVNTGLLDKNTLLESGADMVLDSMQELYERREEFPFFQL